MAEARGGHEVGPVSVSGRADNLISSLLRLTSRCHFWRAYSLGTGAILPTGGIELLIHMVRLGAGWFITPIRCEILFI
jgi:hypothetical protein